MCTKLYGTENYFNKIVARDYSLGQNTQIAEFFRNYLREDFLEIPSKQARERKNKFFLNSSDVSRQFRGLEIPLNGNMPILTSSFSHDILNKMLTAANEAEFKENWSWMMLVVIDAQVNKIIGLGDNLDLLGLMVLTTKDHEPDIKSKCKRIKDGGGHVLWGRVVNNGSAVSRTISYRGCKDGQEVDVTKRNIQNDDILILACDGV